MEYFITYVLIAAAMMSINAAVAGFKGGQWNMDDVIDSILWPLSIAMLVGLIARISFDKYNERLANKPTNAKGTK